MGRIPLLLGVTGHRDLRAQDIAALEAVVRSVYTEFQQRCPATPLLLLSPLAEGADRLTARVALECGVGLIALLPMPRALYEQDFETAESRAEFETLVGQAQDCVELPLTAGNTADKLEAGAEGRDWQYAQVGAYIARHCQVLLALWDGQPSEKVGGTAEVVHLRATGAFRKPSEPKPTEGHWEAPRRGSLDPEETGPIFHLITPRVSNETPPAEALTLRRDYHPRGSGSMEETESHAHKNAAATEAYARIYANLNDYNRNALSAERAPRLAALRNRSAEYLLPAVEAYALPPDLQALRTCHAVADMLAQLYQQDTERVLVFLSCLVFVAALLFEIYEISHDLWFLLGYPLFLGLVYAGWALGVKRGKWQDKYQDYRALAEGLRVAFFWRLVDLTVPVSEHYLRKQRTEMDWIRIAIQNAGGVPDGLPQGAEKTTMDNSRWQLLLKHWVEDQSRYFERSAVPKNERQLERVERRVKWLLLGSQAVPALLALLLLPHAAPEALEAIRHWLETGVHEDAVVSLSALLAVVAGLLHTYSDKKAFSQHVKQYKRMTFLFGRAERHLREDITHGRYRQAAELVLELGQESLEENGDWMLTHRERPVDVPHVG